MAGENIELICVSCPKGCHLNITREGDTFTQIIAGCKRGEDYAKQELCDPRRMVATTVKVKGGIHPLVPVATAAPFPKPQIELLLVELRQVEISAPVHMGQVVLHHALGTEVDVIASRSLDAC